MPEKLESRGAMTAQQLQELLTPREYEMAGLVRDGYSNQDIAATLGTTERTVKNHIYSIFDKIGCDNRVMLAIRYEREQDALSAHNTAELRAALEAKEKELLELKANTVTLESAYKNFERLRSQGAGQWPNCDYSNRPALDVDQICRCDSCRSFAAKLRAQYVAGLASPPEGQP